MNLESEPALAAMAGDPRWFFLSLLLAHLLGDFLLQSDNDVRFKRRPLRLAKHVGIITALSYLLVGAWSAWWLVLTIAISHALIDRLKLWGEDAGWKGRAPFLLDQAAHLGVIVALTLLLPAERMPEVFWIKLCGPVFAQACLILCGAIVAVPAGGFIIGMTVEPYFREVVEEKERRARERTATATDPSSALPEIGEGLARGGMVIGQLERGLIYFFVLVGQPEAVAFLVAAKSVFRFGELSKSRKEAEYILIGTLMSFGWGLLAAWATGWLGRQLGLLG